ncbi:hypothetical protein [Aeromicrobium sp. UC242_57]|uniref:hypothetical protein n=1 Tax=Aeromicrobium sp. UC242_57 TaxID=3374624 RepID=UPI0037BB9104
MPAGPARTTDVAALALDYGERLIVGSARDVHRAVSARAFKATHVIGGHVPESLHDAVVTSVYGAISGVLRISSGSVRALAGRGVGRPVEDGPRGRRVVAAINGLIGDGCGCSMTRTPSRWPCVSRGPTSPRPPGRSPTPFATRPAIR